MVAEKQAVTQVEAGDEPAGTVRKLDRGWYAVKGSDKGGGWWYALDASDPDAPIICECKGFTHHRRCWHVRALEEHLRRERACPICHGKAWIILSTPLRNADGTANEVPPPMPMVCCDGQGTREAWIAGGRLPSEPVDEQPFHAVGMSEAKLREMFS